MSDPSGADAAPAPLEVDAAAARARVESGAARLIDVREPVEWQRGRSPIATLLPMSELGARQDELPTDAPLLIVCHAGSRSARVATALRSAGYDATSVAGGMMAWQASGGDIVADAGRTPAVD